MELERFEDYAIAVTQPYEHNLHFEVKRITGELLDPPAGVWLYEREGWSSADTTTDFELGDPFLSGDVKWDGCSNWDFHSDPVMVHFCSRS